MGGIAGQSLTLSPIAAFRQLVDIAGSGMPETLQGQPGRGAEVTRLGKRNDNDNGREFIQRVVINKSRTR